MLKYRSLVGSARTRYLFFLSTLLDSGINSVWRSTGMVHLPNFKNEGQASYQGVGINNGISDKFLRNSKRKGSNKKRTSFSFLFCKFFF